MSVITLAEAKTFLQITGSSKDALITALIPEIENDLRTLCNRTFKDSSGADSWEAGTKLLAADMIGFRMDKSAGMKSESQGGYSYTRQDIGESGYPVTIEKKMSAFRFVSFKVPRAKSAFRDRRGMGLEDLSEGKAWHGTEGYPL